MASTSAVVYYPFPSEVNVASFVPVKLGAPSDYVVWRKLMLDLIDSHQLEGFIDGTIQQPPSTLEEGGQEEYRSWKRSDGLVRGWLFVTVSKEILPLLVHLETAKDAWIKLEHLFGPSASSEFEGQWASMIACRYLPLYRAIRNGDWESASHFFEEEPQAVRDAITTNSETALMVAVRSSKRNHFVRKLIERMSSDDLERTDKLGQTALHKAVASNNIEAARLLVDKNRLLPNIPDYGGRDNPEERAVHIAASRGYREVALFLLEVTTMEDWGPHPFVKDPDSQLLNGHARLLNDLVNGGLYGLALNFLRRFPDLASMEPHSLQKISYQLTSFRSGTPLNFFERLIYSGITLKLEENANKPGRGDIESPPEGVVSPLSYLSQKLHAMFWDVAEKLVPTIKSVRETKLIHHQALNFVKHLCQEVVKLEHSKAWDIFNIPLVHAVTSGTSEIVEEILELFPSAIKLVHHETGQTLFHLAIEYRQANVFNLIYQLEEANQNRELKESDYSRNNSLHAAGKFSSQQQLSLQANMASAALQIQRELQWFKAIEKLLHPQYRYARNNENKTPQDVFTETHKDLVEKADKWMKDTASSCTIVAALVVTVVFAAAITVPGGVNNNNGLPIFLEDRVFVLFGVFDALALFSSTTSLLMFLSIFTSRYGEQDFLYSLPRKLIIGLVTLFLSILSMMIAFGATSKIVFGYKKAWVVIPVVILSSVPITLFALLQFPLLLDMIRSTYYPGLFKKRSNRIMF